MREGCALATHPDAPRDVKQKKERVIWRTEKVVFWEVIKPHGCLFLGYQLKPKCASLPVQVAVMLEERSVKSLPLRGSRV